MNEGEEFQRQLSQDAAEMSAVDFVKKHGKSNLYIYDRVHNEIDRSVGAYTHLKLLLKQARKYVYDSPKLDYTSIDVENWRGLFIEECDRVLNIGPIELNREYEEEEKDESDDTDAAEIELDGSE